MTDHDRVSRDDERIGHGSGVALIAASALIIIVSGRALARRADTRIPAPAPATAPAVAPPRPTNGQVLPAPPTVPTMTPAEFVTWQETMRSRGVTP